MNLATVFTRSRQSFLIGIALVTLLALGLRVFRLANQSFWIDEVSSIMVAQGPLDGSGVIGDPLAEDRRVAESLS